MTSFSINIQRTRTWLWYRTFGVINCVYANSDDLNMATSHINQWGKSRYFCRSPSRMKTTAVVFISLPGVMHLSSSTGLRLTDCTLWAYITTRLPWQQRGPHSKCHEISRYRVGHFEYHGEISERVNYQKQKYDKCNVAFSALPAYLCDYNLLKHTLVHYPRVQRHTAFSNTHYTDVIMGTIAFQITSLTIVYSDTDQSKHQSSASLAFVWGNHRGPVNSLHKWPVTRKMFPFDDDIMILLGDNLCILYMNWSGINTFRVKHFQNFKILIKIQQFACKEMNLKILSAKWRPSCLGLDVLKEFVWLLCLQCRSHK